MVKRVGKGSNTNGHPFQVGSSPDKVTISRSFPSTWISSLFPVGVQVTPGFKLTVLVNFSPRKLRISTTVLSCVVVMLMGKWAYTALIFRRKPCVI